MVFIAILGVYLPEEAIINEVTTVASSYSIAQFYRTGQIAGDGLRLQIASMMCTNIVDPQTGEISEVLKTSPNAGETTSLRLTRSPANLVNGGCATKSSTARVLLKATKDEARRFPDDCAEALANLARAPAQAVDKIYRLSTMTDGFKPALTGAPDGRSAWVTFSGGLGGENQSSIAKYELGDDGEVKPPIHRGGRRYTEGRGLGLRRQRMVRLSGHRLGVRL